MKEFKNFSKYKTLLSISDQNIILHIDELIEYDEVDYEHIFIILKMLFRNTRFAYKNKREIYRSMNNRLFTKRCIMYGMRSRFKYYKRRPLNTLVKRRF